MAKKTVNIKGAENLRGEVRHITPSVAREFLKTNKKNRRVVASRIERLATAMRNGEWVISQPLMFNCDGTLIDGQHRCHAIVESGVTVPMLILHGFDSEETFAKLDDVAARSLAHWLTIRGEARPDLLAAVIRMHHANERGRNPFVQGGGRGITLTGPMGLDLLDATPDIRKSVTEGPGIINTYLPPRICAYLHFRFAQSDKTLANRFFVDLVSGDYQGDGDPIYLLRERLRSNRNAREKLSAVELAALTIKAWNAYRRDAPLKNLKWQRGGEERSPESFPKIE
jgi:hypothetical protein